MIREANLCVEHTEELEDKVRGYTAPGSSDRLDSQRTSHPAAASAAEYCHCHVSHNVTLISYTSFRWSSVIRLL